MLFKTSDHQCSIVAEIDFCEENVSNVHAIVGHEEGKVSQLHKKGFVHHFETNKPSRKSRNRRSVQ